MSDGASVQMSSLSAERLNAAVARGILTQEQAGHLADFWARQDRLEEAGAPVSRVDAEEVRFARGFHDVFIAIGIVIFLVGLTYGLHDHLNFWQVSAVATMSIWGLSEIFAKRLRLALPSFLLSVAFTPFFFATCIGLFTDVEAGGLDTMVPGGPGSEHGATLFLALPTLIAIAGAVFHYRRFRVPVGMTGITGGVLCLALLLFEAIVPGMVTDNLVWFTLLAGLASFVLAMVFDSRDPDRVTVNSDKAFWLHLMAAPLIVHSILAVATVDAGLESITYAVSVIALFGALALVAIVVDRRALLVSGLGYFGYAIAALMMKADVSGEMTFAITLVVLGCFVLLLGSAWRDVRRLIVRPLSATAVMNVVPAID